MTTGWLFEPVRVTTEPTSAVDPLTRIIPDEPTATLRVWVPTVATISAEVGVRTITADLLSGDVGSNGSALVDDSGTKSGLTVVGCGLAEARSS
jgi:hypothetical protein